MRASGPSGELRCGYQQAARLGAWTLELEARLPRAYTLRARVVSQQDFWITQRPIDIVLHVAQTEWIWRDVSLSQDGDAVVVHIGDKPIVEPLRVAVEG